MHNIRSTIGYVQKTNKKITTPRSYSKKRIKLNESERFSFITAELGGRRPSKIKKRNYINHSQVEDYLKNISKTLNNLNYPQKVKKGSLKVASQNFFEKMFIFLIQKIDPNFQIQEEISSEVLVCILENFGYTDGINEGLFQSIGIPSNWNTLLSVIDDLCKTVKQVEQLDKVILEENQHDIFSQFDVIQKNVICEIMKIQQQDETNRIIQDQLNKELNKQKQLLQQKELTKQNLVMKFEKQKNLQMPLEDLQQQIENQKLQNENYQLNLEKQKNEIDSLRNELQNQSQIYQQFKFDKDNLEQKVQNLQKIIDSQGMTKEQSDMIEQENINLKKQIDQIQQKIENLMSEHTKNTDLFNTLQIQFLEDWQMINQEYKLQNFHLNDFKNNFEQNLQIALSQIEDVRKKIDNSINNTQDQISKKKQEQTKINKEVKLLDQQLQQQQKKVNVIKSQLVDQLKINENFKNSKDLEGSNFAKEIQSKQKIIKNLQEDKSDYLQKEQNIKKNISQLQHQLQQQEEDNNEIEEEFYQQKQKDLHFLQNYKLKMIKALQTQLKRYQEQKIAFKNLYKDKQFPKKQIFNMKVYFLFLLIFFLNFYTLHVLFYQLLNCLIQINLHSFYFYYLLNVQYVLFQLHLFIFFYPIIFLLTFLILSIFIQLYLYFIYQFQYSLLLLEFESHSSNLYLVLLKYHLLKVNHKDEIKQTIY